MVDSLPLEASPYGLDAQSIALLSASGTDKLYYGVALRMTSAPLIFDLNSFTFVGISRGKGGMPERLKIQELHRLQLSTAADRSALSYESYEPALRLPAKSSIFNLFSNLYSPISLKVACNKQIISFL